MLAALEGLPTEQRTAYFESAVCCVFPSGDTVTANGVCRGYIGTAPRGEGGFGYDPIFVTEGGKTFAELTGEQKDAISHRGKALRAFADRLQAYLRKETDQ